MSGVLVLAELRQGELRPISRELVAAAQSIKGEAGGRLGVAVIGSEPGAFGDALGLAGVDEVLAVALPADHFEPHAHEQAVVRLIEQEQPSVVLAPMSVDSLGFAPAVASRLTLGFASDVTSIEWDGGLRVKGPAYGGKVDMELEFPGKACSLILVREGAFDPAPGGESVPVREIELEIDGSGLPSQHVGFSMPASDGEVDITEAPFLLSVGRGIEDPSDLERLGQVAESIGAVLSVSRPLVDAGWAPSSRQVGQSGKTVSPKIYLAMGISGAVQHLAGIRNAETVIAINKDSEAPIFRVADFGAVADMFEVAEELAHQFED